MSIKDRFVIRVCRGPGCGHLSPPLRAAAESEIAARELGDVVEVTDDYCFGRCGMGPNVLVERWRDGKRNERALVALMLGERHPDAYLIHGARPAEVRRAVERHGAELRAAARREP
ncbi:MAG: (2Fe-2S) ferredoxin domain-containing protein [Proteobacteria bacterium]|nr:(2Fe-2S) ferredoxin domain-containing protein [Pseudomonadota bacterium]